jgi:RimJ/RimL family protein N-acetyltransferase
MEKKACPFRVSERCSIAKTIGFAIFIGLFALLDRDSQLRPVYNLRKKGTAMYFTFSLMDEASAHQILRWRYDGLYATYNPGDDPAEMLDTQSPYYAVHDKLGELIGFFCFGTSALVEGEYKAGLFIKERTLPLGLGMRPDLTGQGAGLAFVEAGLEFAQREFQPRNFLLYVYPWNERAIRVYERAGFQRIQELTVTNIHGQSVFLKMERAAREHEPA